MWRAWQCCVSLLLVGVLASVAGAQTNWVGKTILLKRCDIKIGQPYDQSTQTYVPTLALIDYQVLTEEAGRVKVKTHHGTEAWLDKGDVVLLENAADYFTKQLQDNGGNADTYCCRACAWMLTNEFKKGLADFDTALRLDPRARVHFIRGTVWFRKQHYDKAIADFNEAIRLDPKLSLGYNSRAVVWQAKMDNEKAIADCSAAIRIDPKLAVAYLNRGNICYAKNEKDKAIADYSEAVRVDPSYAAAYYNRADAWFDKMDYDKAIADYDEALRIEPKNAAAYCNRGATWQEKKEYGKAIADYDKAVGLNPSLVFAYGARAWVWATCSDGKYRDGKRAVESARRAMGLIKDDAGLQSVLAAAYAEVGDFDEAVRWQERTLMDPQYRDDAHMRWRLELYRNKMPYREE